MTTATTVYAKDALVSLAENLPANLILDMASDSGKFAMDFLFRLTDSQLDTLRTEAKKKKACLGVGLEFFKLPDGSCECARNFCFSEFDWNKVKDIKISGDTMPKQLTSREVFHYLSVVFIMKD